ncbi:hypothetical protein GCM10009548_54480 [Streptomyces malaysiensis subsp. malaysiensis]
MRGVVEAGAGDPQPRRVGGRRQFGPAGRLVLHGQQGVEELLDACGPLYLGQSEMLMRQECRLFALETDEHIEQRLSGSPGHPYRHGVDEQTHHLRVPVEFGGPTGDGVAEDHIGAARHLPEHLRPGTLENRREGQPRRPCPTFEQRGRPALQPDLGHLRSLGGGAVRRHESGLGGPRECRTPGRDCRLRVTGSEQPQVLAERHRYGEVARALGPRGVQVQQLAQQHRQRPAVEEQVVIGEHQTVPVVAEGDQPRPQQRSAGQIEPRQAVGIGRPPRGRLPVGFRKARYVGALPRRGHLCRAEDHGRAQRLVQEGGPEGGVAVEKVSDRVPHPFGVHFAGQVQLALHHVAVGLVGAVHQPEEEQSLLQRGDRKDLPRSVFGLDGREFMGWQRRGQRPSRGSLRADGTGQGGEGGRSAVFQHVAGGQREPGPPGAAHQGQRLDAVAAQVGEAVVGGDLADAEQFLEKGAHQGLPRPGRATPGTGGFRYRQRAPVELAVRGQREGGEDDDVGGHRVAGEHGGHMPADLSGDVGVRDTGPGGRTAGGAGHVADQTAVGGALPPHGGGRTADPRRAQQGRLDLGQLDPVAAHLDLGIGAANELHAAALAHPYAIAGSVHPLPGGAEGVGDEPLGRQVRAPQVAPGQTRAGQVQFAGLPGAHRPQLIVEHMGPGVPDRCAEGDVRPLAHREQAVARGLRRAVQVQQRGIRQNLSEPLDVLPRQRLPAADPEAAQAQTAGILAVEQPAEQARDHGDPADAVSLHQVCDALRRCHRAVRGEDQRRAVQQGAEQLGRAVDETQRRLAEDGFPLLVRKGPAEPAHPVQCPRVHTDDALGPPGRPGGVDDVGGRVRRNSGPFGAGQIVRCRFRQVAQHLGVVERDDVRRGPGQCGGERGRGEHDGRGGVGQYELDAPGRVVGVERHIGAAGLGHGEHRGHLCEGARQIEPDQRLGAHSPREQQAGQPVAGGVQFAGRDTGGALDDGDRARVVGGPLLKGRCEIRAEGGPWDVGSPERFVRHVIGAIGARRDRTHRASGVGGGPQQVADEVVAGLGQLGLGSLVGPGVQVEREAAAAVGRAVDVEGELVHGPGGQLVGDGLDGAETQRPVEGHHVEHQGAESPTGPAQFMSQVLAAITLVAQHRTERPAYPPHQIGDGVPAADGEAQRQFVGEHARGGQRGAADAGGQRQSEQDLVLVAHRPAVGGGERDHEDRPGHTRRASRLDEGPGLLLGQPTPAPHPRAGVPVPAPPGRGRSGQLLQPVRPVAVAPGGLLIGAVLFDQCGEAARGGLGHGPAVGEGGVDLGDPGGVQALAVAVQDRVVVRQDEAVPGGPQTQQRVRHEGVAAEQSRSGREPVGRPGIGRRGRVPVPAEVYFHEGGLGLCLSRRQDMLRQPVVPFGEAHPQRFGVRDGLRHGTAEQVGVDVSGQLQHGPAVERGGVPIELLGDMDAALRGRRGQRVKARPAVVHRACSRSAWTGVGDVPGRTWWSEPAGQDAGSGRADLGPGEERGELVDAGVIPDDGGVDLDAEAVLDGGGQGQAGDGVKAVLAHGRGTVDGLGGVAEQRGDLAGQPVAQLFTRAVGADVGHGRFSSCDAGHDMRCGSRPAVRVTASPLACRPGASDR